MTFKPAPIIALALFALACDGKTETPEDTGADTDTTDTIEDTGEALPVDADGDGFDEESDCDDSDAAVHPDAEEVCDGIDNNCDGNIDLDDDALADAIVVFEDLDLDGYGDSATEQLACDLEEGLTETDGDCDDEDAAVHPDAEDVCDGIDNNCDDTVDGEGLAAWTTANGTTDLTDDFAAASAAAPLSLALEEEGELALCDGTFYAGLIPSADVSVVGHGEVTLSGGGADTLVSVATEGITVSLENLLLTEGNAVNGVDESGSYQGGGALWCLVAASLQLTDVSIIANAGYVGAGVYLGEGCDLQMTGGEVSEHTASASGGGVYIDSATASFSGTTFQNNYGAGGGAVAITGGELTLSDVWMEGNTANAGGALYTSQSTVEIDGSTLTGNSAGSSFGGAMWLYYKADVTITDSTIDGNEAPLAGGAFALSVSSSLSLTDTSVSSNSAGFLGGGGVYMDTTSTVDGERVDFAKNSPDDVYNSSAYTWSSKATFSCASGSCE